VSRTPSGRRLQWSESTDVSNFIRDAARTKEFELQVKDGDIEKKIAIEVPSFADRTRFLRRRLEAVEDELESMEKLKRECDGEAHRGARRMAVGGLAMLIVYWGAVARLTFWDLGW
jgi:calcium uniporter protein, mitochondrial